MMNLLFLMLALYEPLLIAQEPPIRVEGDVAPPEVLRRVEPKLGELLRTRRTSGVVILEAIIDRQGRVRNAHIVRSPHPPEVNAVFVHAIEQWRFKPATLHGKPVAVYFTTTILLHPR